LLRRIVSKVRDTEALFSPPSEAVITRAEQDLVDYAASNVAVIEIVPDSEAWWHFGSEREQVELNYMDEALMAEDLMEFGADLKVISPKSLADRIRAGFEAVIASHA
jgi:proteasome accessory factor B